MFSKVGHKLKGFVDCIVCLDTVGKKLCTEKTFLCEGRRTEGRTWWRGEAKEVGETR